MTDTAPDLSIVATSRNDDHGGGMLRRMQIFVDGLLQQARRHDLNAELILVEWNPPADRPRLVQALAWPQEPGPCIVRIIEVPPELHRRFKYSDKLPLFQMIAKNVGIRRARGAFVLATNVDLLFSDELTHFLASGQLDPDCMYRVDRYDVRTDVPVGVPIEDQIEYCRQNVIRVNMQEGSHSERSSRGLRRSVISILVQLHLASPYDLWKDLTDPQALRRLIRRRVSGVKRLNRQLHTNGCGDFTLLSRERWLRLRGYPEWEMYSMHLDGVLCHMALEDGARQVVLPEPHRLYHIEHHSGWTPEQTQTLRARMASLGVPMLDLVEYEDSMARRGKGAGPITVNGETWGLAHETLRETTLHEIGGLRATESPS